jgi:hypothetical protein
MLDPVRCFVQQLQILHAFRISLFPRKAYQLSLTAISQDEKRHVVLLPEVIERAKALPGCLIVDDTGVEKYGLNEECRVLFNHASKQFGHGYKLLLFLWHCEEGYLPLGFALWFNGSPSLIDLTLNGFSVLRNHYQLKPLMVLADAYFFNAKTTKRLDDYGWGFIMRCQKNRKLDNQGVRYLIPRGYGQTTGHLPNGITVQVIRHAGHFLATNRKLLCRKQLQALYKLRWAIEETFRFLKTTLGLTRCQQRTMQAQGNFVSLCLQTLARLQQGLGQLTCKTLQAVMFVPDNPTDSVQLSFFSLV